MTQPSNPTPVRTIGIDLGDRESSYCILDQDGKVIDEGVVLNDRHAMKQMFPGMDPARVVIEASCQSQWISRCLKTNAGHGPLASPIALLDHHPTASFGISSSCEVCICCRYPFVG